MLSQPQKPSIFEDITLHKMHCMIHLDPVYELPSITKLSWPFSHQENKSPTLLFIPGKIKIHNLT